MFGRFLSGVATSLLFSTFEAWMVSEHHSRNFDASLLGDTFGKARAAVFEPGCRGVSPRQQNLSVFSLLIGMGGQATLGNGIAAVMAGLVAGVAADTYGFVAPFLVCLIPLSLVAVLVAFVRGGDGRD